MAAFFYASLFLNTWLKKYLGNIN